MAGKRKKQRSVSEEEQISNTCLETITVDIEVLSSTNTSNATKSSVVSEVLKGNSGSPLKKISSIPKASPRRSSRHKSPALPSGVESVVEHINLIENETEEASHCKKVNIPVTEENSEDRVQKVQEDPMPPMNGTILEKEASDVQQVNAIALGDRRDIEEKLHYLVRSVDEFKTVITERPNNNSSTYLNYRSLYVHSQKKIEALMEENTELNRELEFARGKIAAYENMKNVFSSSQEVIVVSNLGNNTTTDAASLQKRASAGEHSTPLKQKKIKKDDSKLYTKPKQNLSFKKKPEC